MFINIYVFDNLTLYNFACTKNMLTLMPHLLLTKSHEPIAISYVNIALVYLGSVIVECNMILISALPSWRPEVPPLILLTIFQTAPYHTYQLGTSLLRLFSNHIIMIYRFSVSASLPCRFHVNSPSRASGGGCTTHSRATSISNNCLRFH